MLTNFSNVSGNFGGQGVCYDSFLLDASIRTEEILAPLPPYDPTGWPDKYLGGLTGNKNKQVQEKRILYQ